MRNNSSYLATVELTDRLEDTNNQKVLEQHVGIKYLTGHRRSYI